MPKPIVLNYFMVLATGILLSAPLQAPRIGSAAKSGKIRSFPVSPSFNSPTPPTPKDLRAAGYDSHVEIRWRPSEETSVSKYRLYRSTDNGQNYEQIRTFFRTDSMFIDWVRPLGTDLELQYRISSEDAAGEESPLSDPVEARTREMSDEELMTMVQAYTFRYFWDFAHPVSGLARERNTSGDVVTMGGSGFGVMAILVGIERGFIARQQGLDRLLQMVLFLENADRFRGAYPHWMDGRTGEVIPFSPLDDGGDIVETAFLFEGLLCARQYFQGNTPEEVVLRTKITQLYEEINWNWYRKQNQNVIYWHWSPQHNFAINLPVRGWNETMMVYLLGIASPTFPVPPSLWEKGWAGGNYQNGHEYYGIELPVGPFRGGPLFFTHYSFLGFDPRDRRDQYANYFVQNRNQTLINRAYCIDNPENHEGYGPDCWGLTASDDPIVGYLAHEPVSDRDNGTIAPTAALSSMPYTPEESITAMKHFYREHGEQLWGPMGFYDAFNLDQDWFADSYLAIDQGPIIGMIENHRTGLLWDLFMSNPEIQEALAGIGFVPDSTTAIRHSTLAGRLHLYIFPNPPVSRMNIRLELEERLPLELALFASTGKRLKTISPLRQRPPGGYDFQIDVSTLSPGIYFLKISTGDETLTKKFVITGKS
jgi:hypothetical protein